MKNGSLTILLVEDDHKYVILMQHAAEQRGTADKLLAVHDGAQAIRYLRGEGEYSDRHRFPFPNAIFSDLHMPGMDGFEFLRCLREQPDWSAIPAIVLSSSHIPSDIEKAYKLGASAFITKPSSLRELIDLMRTTCEFWSWCQSPPLPAAC